MAGSKLRHLILIVVGASLRAEEADRPLGYRLAGEAARRLGEGSPWRVLVISDVLYLNDRRLRDLPVISIGGPGVNNLSAAMYDKLPAALAVDNVLIIQMDVELNDLRACLWGMNHDQTVEALELFIGRGYLDRFVEAVVGRRSAG